MVDNDLHALDKRLSNVETILHRVETNHLSHMEASMAKMESRMWWGMIAVFGQFTLICVSAIGFLLSKIIG